jgi:hypothetical protein
MFRCPECGERLPDELDGLGSRCPACREPLYDDPPRRRPTAEVGQCAVHPENPALGTCGRCGNYVCAVCRTRWRERWLCAACVDRALERRDAAPAEAGAHTRQAILGLALGLCGWAMFVLALVVAAAAQGAGDGTLLIVLAGFLVLASPLPSVIGLGQAVAALRSRGDHMILATLGLILCGLNVGVLIGLLSFGIAVQI